MANTGQMKPPRQAGLMPKKKMTKSASTVSKNQEPASQVSYDFFKSRDVTPNQSDTIFFSPARLNTETIKWDSEHKDFKNQVSTGAKPNLSSSEKTPRKKLQKFSIKNTGRVLGKAIFNKVWGSNNSKLSLKDEKNPFSPDSNIGSSKKSKHNPTLSKSRDVTPYSKGSISVVTPTKQIGHAFSPNYSTPVKTVSTNDGHKKRSLLKKHNKITPSKQRPQQTEPDDVLL